MVSRREVITAGLAGGLASSAPVTRGLSGASAPGDAAFAPAVSLAAQDRDALNALRKELSSMNGALRAAFVETSRAHGSIIKIRDMMEVFFKSNGKFPDYIDVGYRIFVELYDWHIKNNQQLAVARGADGRYSLQFMFTVMVLRPEVDVNHIGVPYDRA